MKFGITLKPDHRFDRSVDLARRAEANGFGHGWMFDSHILWRDPYPLLTLMGEATSQMRLGTCVTNPATRDITVTASALATLNEITGGRMDLGIGRGDSARRVMGKKPTTVAYMEECCRIVRALTAGEKVEVDGTEIQMPWATGGPVPVWVAGYGPMALAAAGLGVAAFIVLGILSIVPAIAPYLPTGLATPARGLALGQAGVDALGPTVAAVALVAGLVLVAWLSFRRQEL